MERRRVLSGQPVTESLHFAQRFLKVMRSDVDKVFQFFVRFSEAVYGLFQLAFIVPALTQLPDDGEETDCK